MCLLVYLCVYILIQYKFFNNLKQMKFYKCNFLLLVLGLLLQSCGTDTAQSKAVTAPGATSEIVDNVKTSEAKIDSVNNASLSDQDAGQLAALEQEKAEKARIEKAKEIANKKEMADKIKAKKEEEREARKKRREKRRKQRAEEAKARKAKNSSTQSSSSRKPVVEFYKTTYNYGKIEQGDKVEYNFKFKNTGGKELVISNATATCGCTQPSFPFIPIGPGEEGYIGVVFDSKGKLGRQKPAITITTNAKPASYTLYLEGFVNSPKEEEAADKDAEEGKL